MDLNRKCCEWSIVVLLGLLCSSFDASAAGLLTRLIAPSATRLPPAVRQHYRCAAPIEGRLVQTIKACRFKPNSLGPLPPYSNGPQPAPKISGAPPIAPAKIKDALKRAFAYYPPGRLHRSSQRRGRIGDRHVYLPNIIYPLRLGTGLHPHMNSQIYGFGGGGWGGRGAAGGSECDPRNYDPRVQTDNYCEARGWKMPLCPSGTGHQGQDIRPPTCVDSRWDVLAVTDGIVTRVTRNTTVVLKGKDGTSYTYLHMHPRSITVHRGSQVRQGQLIGKVSKFMGGRRSTTTHLHFQARQTLSIGTRKISAYVPVYTSLIAAYRKAKGLGNSIDANGDLVVDTNFEIEASPGSGPAQPPEPAQQPSASNKGLAKELSALRKQLAAQRNDLARANDTTGQLAKRLRASLDRIDELEVALADQKRASEKRSEALRSELAELRARQDDNLLPRLKRVWQSLVELLSKDQGGDPSVPQSQ